MTPVPTIQKGNLVTTPKRTPGGKRQNRPQVKTVQVRRHKRVTSSGKTTTVRSHSRTLTAWKKAGIAWAGTAGSGMVTLALIAELGFAIISTICILLTLALGLLSTWLTSQAGSKKRRIKSRTKSRPRPRPTRTRR